MILNKDKYEKIIINNKIILKKYYKKYYIS